MVQVDWKGKMEFLATPPSGNAFTLDAHHELGGQNLGPTPLEAMLSAIGACAAMDVIVILEKKKQVVTSYRVEVGGVRTEEGVYPRPFTDITVRHILTGENLDPAAVERAVQLSDEKYCTIIATLRQGPNVKSEWAIE